MEVALCTQKAGGHAASLLASLNLQRERAQFCDCIIRLSQSPGELHPAHRCVLAASSPVLASILSSTSALVELQAPCLSDSVLRLVLNYIYRGTLPYTQSQQQYSNLLTAACYLQMDELKETLRTKLNPVDTTNFSTGPVNQPHEGINNTYINTVSTLNKYLPSSATCSVISLEGEDQCWDDTDTCGRSNENSTNAKCISNDTHPSSNGSPSCASGGAGSTINTDRQIAYPTPRGSNQSVPSAAEVNRMSRVDKEMQEDQFYSAGAAEPESRRSSTKEDLLRVVESRRSLNVHLTAEAQEEQTSIPLRTQSNQTETSRKEEQNLHHSLHRHLSSSHVKVNASPLQCSSLSPSSPHLYGGAVPVIRHSSAATVAEVYSVPLYHPVSQAPVSCGRAPDSGSGHTANDRLVEGITTKTPDGAQDQNSRNNKDHTGTLILYRKNSSSQSAIQDFYYKSNGDQLGVLKQERNRSAADHDEHMDVELSQITDDNDHRAHCESSQNHTKPLRDDLTPLNKDCNSFIPGFKHDTENNLDDFTSKHHQRDCQNLFVATASDEQSIQSREPRAVVPLPVQDSNKGSACYCGGLCPEGEVKEEESYSSKCPAEMNRQDTHCDSCAPQHDWHSNMHGTERCTTDAASSHSEHDAKDAAMDNAVTSESHQKCSMPVDDVSDHMYSTVEQSYHGHLHYHCIPQEVTHLPHTGPDHKHSHLSHPDHSDPSSSEDEAGTFHSPCLGSLRQHFATADQVLLLDISNKPAELLVSYRGRSDELEQWVAFNQQDTSGNELGGNDGEPQLGTSLAREEKRKIRARTKRVAESFNKTESKLWLGERNTEERKSVGKVQSRPAPEVAHKPQGLEGENQTTTLTLCPSPCVPDSVQAAVSSTLSACIPSHLSASMPTNTSAPLPSPVHYPIQCSLCNRSFSQRGSLNRHMRSHLGVRPFPCPRCPMTFSRQYRVLEHMRVHQRCVLGSDFQKPPASVMCENVEMPHK